jgi:hypothetical protein
VGFQAAAKFLYSDLPLYVGLCVKNIIAYFYFEPTWFRYQFSVPPVLVDILTECPYLLQTTCKMGGTFQQELYDVSLHDQNAICY